MVPGRSSRRPIEAINANFSVGFQTLFGGGTGEIAAHPTRRKHCRGGSIS